MPECLKQSYPTPAAAGLALRAIRCRQGSTKRPVGIYPCRICAGWHLTSDLRSAENKWTKSVMRMLGNGNGN